MIIFKRISAFLILFSAIILTSCSSKKEEKPSISGNIKNFEKETFLLYKVEDIQAKSNVFIDTIKVNNLGDFSYNKPLETSIYKLVLNPKQKVQIAYVKGQLLEVSGNNIDSLKFSGSLDTQLLLDYEVFRKESLTRLVYSVRNEIKALININAPEKKIAELRELEVINYEIHLSELTSFIEKNMGSSIAIYPTSIRWNGDNLKVYNDIVTNFKKAHSNSEITSKLVKRVQLLQKTAVGSFVSNIEMPSSKGEIVSLNNIKKTYTLIDFWASWCPPCRSESSLLNQLYANYNAQGFEIYGISLDSKKKRWLDALEKDNRVWVNVSTVEGFKTPVAQEYGITALPTNFIIDSEGKIIASNIHGKHLKEFIEELFK